MMMTRKLLFLAMTTVALAFVLCLGVDHVYAFGLSHGPVLVAVADPPTPDSGGFLGLIMTGKWIPAVGAFLIAFVAAVRTIGATKIPWLKTKAGGIVLGFGSAALLYLGAAWQAGADTTMGLFGAALAAGWAAAGGWEHISDLIAWLRPTPPAVPKAIADGLSPSGRTAIQAAIVVGGISVCIGLGGLLVQACAPVKNAGTVVIDCTKASAAQTAALLDQLKPLLSGERVDWAEVEGKAIEAGETIGGCVLAELVQGYLGGVKATPVGESWTARNALEDFRTHHANGATFHTQKYGDL
jgi:hypothetical protein